MLRRKDNYLHIHHFSVVVIGSILADIEGEIQLHRTVCAQRTLCVLPLTRRSSAGRTLPLCSLTALHRLPPSLVVVSLLCVLYGRASPCLMVKIEFPTWANLCIMCVSVSPLCALSDVRCCVRKWVISSSFPRGKVFGLSSKWNCDRHFGASPLFIVKTNLSMHVMCWNEISNVSFTPTLSLTCVCGGLSQAARHTPAQADRCFMWASRHLVTRYFIQTSAAAGFKIAINPLLGMISAPLRVEWAFPWK